MRDGGIVAVGPPRSFAASSRERIVRASHVLLPGFVNAHTHASMSLLRGLPVCTPLMPWLRETIWPAEHRWVSPDFVRDGTQLAIAEMLRAGITSFGDMYLSREAARAAAAARVRAVIGLPVSEAPTSWAEDTIAYFARRSGSWDEYKSNPWVSLYFAPHPPYAVSDATLRTRAQRGG